ASETDLSSLSVIGHCPSRSNTTNERSQRSERSERATIRANSERASVRVVPAGTLPAWLPARVLSCPNNAAAGDSGATPNLALHPNPPASKSSSPALAAKSLTSLKPTILLSAAVSAPTQPGSTMLPTRAWAPSSSTLVAPAVHDGNDATAAAAAATTAINGGVLAAIALATTPIACGPPPLPAVSVKRTAAMTSRRPADPLVTPPVSTAKPGRAAAATTVHPALARPAPDVRAASIHPERPLVIQTARGSCKRRRWEVDGDDDDDDPNGDLPDSLLRSPSQRASRAGPYSGFQQPADCLLPRPLTHQQLQVQVENWQSGHGQQPRPRHEPPRQAAATGPSHTTSSRPLHDLSLEFPNLPLFAAPRQPAIKTYKRRGGVGGGGVRGAGRAGRGSVSVATSAVSARAAKRPGSLQRRVQPLTLATARAATAATAIAPTTTPAQTTARTATAGTTTPRRVVVKLPRPLTPPMRAPPPARADPPPKPRQQQQQHLPHHHHADRGQPSSPSPPPHAPPPPLRLPPQLRPVNTLPPRTPHCTATETAPTPPPGPPPPPPPRPSSPLACRLRSPPRWTSTAFDVLEGTTAAAAAGGARRRASSGASAAAAPATTVSTATSGGGGAVTSGPPLAPLGLLAPPTPPPPPPQLQPRHALPSPPAGYGCAGGVGGGAIDSQEELDFDDVPALPLQPSLSTVAAPAGAAGAALVAAAAAAAPAPSFSPVLCATPPPRAGAGSVAAAAAARGPRRPRRVSASVGAGDASSSGGGGDGQLIRCSDARERLQARRPPAKRVRLRSATPHPDRYAGSDRADDDDDDDSDGDGDPRLRRCRCRCTCRDRDTAAAAASAAQRRPHDWRASPSPSCSLDSGSDDDDDDGDALARTLGALVDRRVRRAVARLSRRVAALEAALRERDAAAVGASAEQ
ncbi:hypothetical protein DFJ73DRAFT_900859, partial [Zopfochytrium polystomum]